MEKLRKKNDAPPGENYLPEFRVQGLEYYSSESSRTGSSSAGITPWENHQSVAKEDPTAISELQKDGIVLKPTPQRDETKDTPSVDPAANKYQEFKGLVRMTRDQYDHVLKIRPGAALKYIDEDDGELINVGSSFELEQRLQEPVDGKEPVNVDDFAKCIPVAEKPRHSFTVAESTMVKTIWRGWESETHIRRYGASQGAGKLAGESIKLSADPAPPNYQYIPPSTSEEIANGFQMFRARKALSKMSPNGKAREIPIVDVPDTLPYENRWASYASLPDSLDKKAVSLDEAPQSSKNTASLVAENAPNANKNEPTNGEKHIDVQAVDQQEPSTSTSEQPATKIETSQEVSANTSAEPSTYNLLAESVLSLIEQFGNFATETFKTSPEVSEQMKIAKKEIPHNIELALRAGAQAVDQVRKVIDASNEHHKITLPTATQAVESSSVSASEYATANEVDSVAESSTPAAQDLRRSTEDVVQPLGANKVYQAEKIIGYRRVSYGDHPALTFTQYLVRWVGRPETDDVWYDEENLGDCGALIADYESRRRDTYENMFRKVTEASELHTRTSGEKCITHPRTLHSFEKAKQAQASFAPFATSQNVVSHAVPLYRDVPETSTTKSTERSDLLIDIDVPTREKKERAAAIGLRNRRAMLSMPDVNRYKPAEIPIPEPRTDGPSNTKSPRPVSIAGELPSRAKNEITEKSQGTVKSQNSRYSLIDAVPEPWPTASTQLESQNPPRPLKHRKSWHPGTASTLDRPFNFSAADVMARYPSLSQLESSSAPRLDLEGQSAIAPTVSSGSSNTLRPSKSVELRPPPPPSSGAEQSSKPTSQAWVPAASQPSVSTSQPIRRAATVRERRVRWPDTVDELLGEPNRLNRAATSASAAYRNRDAGRRDRKQKDIERRLVEMGFSKTEAETASAAAEGNLETAIDLLEEDQAAWKGRQGGRPAFMNDSANYSGQMPGAWESWRNQG